MPAASLKGYIPALARLLGLTPAALYERQRALVRAGLLDMGEGRGPGSGVRATAPAVALLLIAVLATDSLSETEARTGAIAIAIHDPSDDQLTPHATFRDAVADLLTSRARSAKILDLTVSRTAARAIINYRDKTASKALHFGNRETMEPALSVAATLSGDVFRQIAKDVIAMVSEDAAPKSQERKAG